MAPHLIGSAPQPRDERIDCAVSKEVLEMWKEITEDDRKKSKERYYPAYTLERLIKADYKIKKAFGSS